MKVRHCKRIVGWLSVLLILASVNAARAHLGDDRIVAPIIDNIVIDGDLSDWPAHMDEHYVLSHGQAYGPTDIDHVDLTSSPDLTPKFKVGYSPKTQLLYVAATVRDDEHVMDLQIPYRGDCLEICVDGDHNGGVYQPERQTHQYAGLAGDVRIEHRYSTDGDNYYMSTPHDVKKTRSQMGHNRSGDVTTYEWAIEVFDHHPDQPTQLEPGKTLGFSVAVIDKDDDGENVAWVTSGPYAPGKVRNADLLNDLLLGDASATDMANGGRIAGTATDADTGQPLANFLLAAYQGEHQVSRTRTDAKGGFLFYRPAGTYTLKLQRGQGYTLDPTTSTVATGQETVADLSLTPIRLPAALQNSAALYAGLQSYSDSSEVEFDAGLQGVTAALAWQDSNLLRLESIDWESGNASAFHRDGRQQSWYEAQFQQYIQYEATTRPQFSAIPRFMPGLRLVQQLLLSADPHALLRQGLEGARQVGSESLGGHATTVVELTLVPTTGSMPNAAGLGTTNLRLWIDAETAALRQASYERDGDPFIERYSHIQLNPLLAADHFHFNIPPDAAQAFRMGEGGNSKKLIDQPAPDFTLVDYANKKVQLADFAGQVLLIDFWGTWCPPCLVATPYLNELYETYAVQGFNIVGISSGDKAETVRSYAAKHNIAFPLPLADNTVLKQYGVSGFPTVLFVDKQGVVRFVHSGFGEDMKTAYTNHIEELLAE